MFNKAFKVTLVLEGDPADVEQALLGAHKEAAYLEGSRDEQEKEVSRLEASLREALRREADLLEQRERARLNYVALDEMCDRLNDRIARLEHEKENLEEQARRVSKGVFPGTYPSNLVAMTDDLKKFIATAANYSPLRGAALDVPSGVLESPWANKIPTIKMVRETFGLGLKEGKDLVEWCIGLYRPY